MRASSGYDKEPLAFSVVAGIFPKKDAKPLEIARNGASEGESLVTELWEGPKRRHQRIELEVEVKVRINGAMTEEAAGRIATSFAMGIQPLRKLWNNWHWRSRFCSFGITDCAPPHRSCDVQPSDSSS
jgi:hypothetical protein